MKSYLLAILFMLIIRPEFLYAFETKVPDFNMVQSHKIVEITPESVPSLAGKTYESISVFALKNGKLQPIPFQFEEYDDKGFLFQGKVKGVDKENVGVFDQQDLLVFMLKDSGAKATDSQLENLKLKATLELLDDGAKSYVYVVESGERSSTRYVSYNSETGLITMPEALVYMNPKDLLDWGDVFAKEGDSFSEKSFMDTLIVRITGEFLKIPIRLNNKNLQAKLENVYSGPVRITLDAEFRAIVAKIPLIRAHAQIHIDSHSARVFVNINAPTKYAKLIKDPQIILGIDGNELYGGFVKTSVSGNQSFLVDGKMDQHERSLNEMPVDDDVSWIWLSDKDDFNIIGQFDVRSRDDYNPEEYTDVTVFYRDDVNHIDKLERFPGSLPTLGYRMRSIPSSDKVGMSYKVFFIRGLKPLEAGDYLSRLDNPSMVSSQPSKEK